MLKNIVLFLKQILRAESGKEEYDVCTGSKRSSYS